MTVFVLLQTSFDRWYTVGIFDSLEKARSAQSSKEIADGNSWDEYSIVEWDVE